MRSCISCGKPVACSYDPPRCSACNTKRNKERYQIISSKVNEIKLELGCADCGFKGHHAALEFDHLPEYEKLFQLSNAYRYTWSKVEMEIAKCEVVCANCHAIRTYNRRREINAK